VRYVGAVSALTILIVALSGCSHRTDHSRPPGTVSGVAAPCAGPASAALGPVEVSAREHGRTVASQVVSLKKDRDRYRLVLPPGRYVITASGSADVPLRVVLHSGEHVTINFPDFCD